MLRAAARDYLGGAFGADQVVRLADSDAGWDPDSWGRIAELGWIGISLDGKFGGAGMTFLEEAVLFEETGRALYPGPFFSTVALALPALEAAGDGAAIAAVVQGKRTATLAWAEDEATRIDGTEAPRTAASRAGEAWTVSGHKLLVPDATIADDAVVVASAGGGVGLWLVDLHGAGVEVIARSTMDRTRRLGEVVLDGAPARLLVAPGDATPVLRRIRLQALAALSCEAVGLAQDALERAKTHVSERQQFGRPIASYQGVSHRVANVYMAVELARSLAYRAAWCVAVDDAEVEVACAAAKSGAAEAAVFACENAIQVMGGIGFTWEQPMHRFYKRAQAIEAFEGFGREHRATIAAALLDAP